MMKRNGFFDMAHKSPPRQLSRWSANDVLSALRSIACAVTADHALAQRAAIEAAQPRKHLAGLRATCLAAFTPPRQVDEHELTPDGAQRGPAPKKERPEWPSWSSPFPKPRR
jgi:hypothetical protein